MVQKLGILFCSMMKPQHDEPLNPVTGEALSPVHRQVWRFRMAAHEAQTILRGLHISARGGDISDVLDDNLLFTITNQGKLVVCKFLEIWDDFGRLAKTDSQVRAIRNALQPIINRMRIWPGLDRFRNTALAHPYTTKSGALVTPWHLFEAGDAPSYHAETILLLQCVHLAVLGVLLAFPKEYQEVLPLLSGGLDEDELDPGLGISKGTEIAGELRRVLSEVDPRLRQIGIEVDGPIAAEFKLATKVNPEDRPYRSSPPTSA
jgi:hypothetical protein